MKKILSVCLILLNFAFNAYAADEKQPPPVPQSEYAYYSFESEIVTHYISNRKKLGFVNTRFELMLVDPGDLITIECHEPLC